MVINACRKNTDYPLDFIRCVTENKLLIPLQQHALERTDIVHLYFRTIVFWIWNCLNEIQSFITKIQNPSQKRSKLREYKN